VMRKTTQCIAELMEQSGDKLMENALVNGESKAHRKIPQSPLKVYLQGLRGDLTAYMTRFQWDRAKYPTALPLKSLSDLINKQVAQVETELKSRNAAYSDVKMSLRTLEQKMEGSLHTRALTGIVRKDDLVLNSEYLTTLLVVVPRTCIRQWENTYESMSEFVVPRSSRKLLEEEDAGIFTVTLFKNAVNKFKASARIHKFAVRDFNLEESEWQRQEMSRLSSEEKDQYGMFVRWLKVNIKEVFVAWIHIKALRVFVESVLRFGLPVSFQALLLQPERKQIKRLREELSSVFTHLDPMAAVGKQE
ncbi:V-type proton ATPase subunit C 1-B-like, partial [Clarias magur]